MQDIDINEIVKTIDSTFHLQYMALPSISKPKPNDLGDRFFRLAVVNILSNLMVPLAGLVDVAFLGHLTEIRHLAGVALATVLFNYIYWTFGFLRMGTTGTTAQAVGRGDKEEVLLTLLRNSVLALGVGLIILVLQHPLRELGFTLLSAKPDVKLAGQAYYDTLIWGAPATLLNFVLIGWFLGREQGSKVLLLSLVGNGANVVLDYLLIVRWGWESAGAGLATGASQYLMLLVGIILICQEHWLGKVKAMGANAGREAGGASSTVGIAKRILERSALKAAFMLNGDILVRTFALVSTFAVFTNLSSGLGTVVLATNTLLLQVVTLAAYFIDGVAFATESFAGIFRGKGAREQLIPLVRISGGTSLILGLIFALVFNLFPAPVFGLLTNHKEVIDPIGGYVGWLVPILGFGSVAYMLDGYFLGLTEGRILRKSTVTAAIIGFAPVAVVAWWFHSSQLLWLALSAFMVGRVVTLGMQVPRTFND
ncbi:MAG TPA: guanitoxin biosynthesis MATE family efflux transporter GntT [Coleofasciculaceae cyanobacterium]